MIFVFDTYERGGIYLPNLITDTSIKPQSPEWWDLCIKPPYSYEFRFLRYLWFDKVKFRIENIRDVDEPCVYPINLNFFDPGIDQFEYMSDLAKQKARDRMLTIWFYYCEGDDVKWDIDRRLHQLAEQHQIQTKQIKFTMGNRSVTENELYSYFPDHEFLYRYLNTGSNYIKQVNFKLRSKKFTCLNRMDKPFRRIFAATLVSKGFDVDAYFSYTDQKYAVEKTVSESDVSQWDSWDHAVLDRFDPPYRCDELQDHEHNLHKLIDERFFQDAYWNVVVETDIATLFLTEKTIKHILNLQPCVIVGAPGSIQLLHELGYKTFSKWIDESYDSIEDSEQRLKKCLELVKQISSMTHAEHVKMQQDMAEILLYNQRHFLSDKSAKLLNLLDKISQ